MVRLVLLLLQAVAPADAPVPGPPAPAPSAPALTAPLAIPDFVLSTRCAPAAPDEIVVCARRPAPERNRVSLPAEPEGGPPRADVRLFGDVHAAAEVTEHSRGGASAPAFGVTVRVPF